MDSKKTLLERLNGDLKRWRNYFESKEWEQRTVNLHFSKNHQRQMLGIRVALGWSKHCSNIISEGTWKTILNISNSTEETITSKI